MKTMKKIVCALMTLVLLLSSVPAAFADEAKTIDQDAACSLTVWKFDYTNAKKDDVWDEDAFPSTGWQESYVENALVNTNRKGDTDGQNGNALGNGQTSKGYAIAGVEFTYLKAADIVTFENQGTTQVLYGFHKTDAADLLKAIGLENGANRCAEADSLDADRYFYTSDTLNKALAQSLEANSTTVKNTLETFIRNGGTAMAPTSEVGKTSAKNLSVGLYLLVETKVPEMVTSTTNPFFVSLPMTTITGNDNSASQDGGTAWNYDVVVYPKQETGIPTLEKTVREAKADTGKNEGSTSITDGFAHTATGSAGDTMEYQIVSTLPTITSQATALSTYNFYDTLCEGLTYKKDAGVTVEFFTDAACTDKVATWNKDSSKFTVTYSEDGRHMTVDIAKAGLDEINGVTANKNGKLYTGYSNYTARVTYSAVINSDKSFAYGEKGNENTVILTWKRTSGDYYDTLIDDCHVFSFGLDLTKLFSDVDAETAAETKLYDSVKFKIQNKTDGTWIIAKRNDEEGVYYVTGHTDKEADATVFTPVTIPLTFTAAEGFDSSRRYFISDDEVSQALRGHESEFRSRLDVFSFFIRNTDAKEREKFLKRQHGEYSGYHGGNDNRVNDSTGFFFSHGSIGAPYAQVSMKWPAVTKWVSNMISTGTYLYPSDTEKMAEYEIRQLAKQVMSFFSNTPEGFQRPTPRSDFDYWDGVAEIQEQLSNPEQVNIIYASMMKPLMEATQATDRSYETRKRGMAAMEAYRAGTFSVFGRAHTLRPLPDPAQPNLIVNEDLEKAKMLVTAFCAEEYDSEPDFSDLHKINIAYTTITDEEVPVQVSVDLVDKQVDSNEDNMLVITNDGRKLALDQRLINPMLPDSDSGKVAVCAENVYNIWEGTAAQKSTQMVFVDLSTPHNDGQFNVYDDLKKKLLDKGIPESEIAYIHNAKTEAAKKELFGKVRSGEVRVLIGSTQKMGAGTNAQRKLIALHHMDCRATRS